MMRDTGAPLQRMTFLQPSARLNPLRLLARLHHWLTRPSPVRYVAFGYLAYMALGWALLSLPAVTPEGELISRRVPPAPTSTKALPSPRLSSLVLP